jgi:hypothetical protein
MPHENDFIANAVIHVVAVVSGFDDASIKESDRLFEDLGLADESKRSLAPSFQRIARKGNDAARITKKECGELLTVKGCVKLVTKKSESA